MVCIFHVVGKKDTGKTGVIERVVKEFKEKGFKVAVIKHSHHKIDLAGKDTDRFRNAGSDYILFQEGNYESILFIPKISSITLLSLLPVDIIVIEGFSNIEIGRKYLIENPRDIEKLTKAIISDASQCQRIKVNLKINGNITEISSDNPMLLLLYNLMKVLGIADVSSS